MTKVCLFTATASRELENILDYVARLGNLDASERLLAQINATCQKITNFPGMGVLLSFHLEFAAFPFEII